MKSKQTKQLILTISRLVIDQKTNCLKELLVDFEQMS